jgi:hypothetical protein
VTLSISRFSSTEADRLGESKLYLMRAAIIYISCMRMSKRSFADVGDSYDCAGPSQKLQRVSLRDGSVQKRDPINIESHIEALPDELLLRILGFLSSEELMGCQRFVFGIETKVCTKIIFRLSRRIAGLAKDSHLWKRLYLQRFSWRRLSKLTGEKAHNIPNYLRLSQSKWGTVGVSQSGVKVDWKSEYRLRHKWANGTCRYREIIVADEVQPRPLLCLQDDIAITADEASGLRAWSVKDQEQTFIASTRFTVDEYGHGSNLRPSAISVEISVFNRGLLDIAVGFDDGTVGLYTMDPETRQLTPKYLFQCFDKQAVSSLCQSGSTYILAMSDTHTLSLYKLPEPQEDLQTGKPDLISVLKSHSNWKPISLRLRVTAEALIASISYAFPTYRSGWSVGLQELRWASKDHAFIQSRLATAQDNIASYNKSRPSRSRYLPPTTSQPTSLCYSHPYLLATHPDNTLSLYMVRSTDSELTISPGMRLWGHTSDVYAANVGERGKAVTVAHGGEVRVWELEGGLISSIAKKATPGPLTSVKIQPAVHTKILEENGISTAIISGSSEDSCEYDTQARERSGPASIDFNEERLVILKDTGSKAQALFIYDFT